MLSLDLKTLLTGGRTTPFAKRSKPKTYDDVTVIGAGAWGTALAIAFARAGARVRLWGRNEAQMQAIKKSRKNRRYLGEVTLPTGVIPTHDLETAVQKADAVFMVVPSKAMRDMVARVGEHLKPGTPVVSCTKGLDPEDNVLLTDLIKKELPTALPMFLSGPSFAQEVAEGHQTHVVLAGDLLITTKVAERLCSDTFHLQPVDDLIGAQIGGLMKNVVAIACGISDGFEHGSNTRAAIMARGLEEASRLCVALGGDPATLLGVAGAGDLALTCTDPQSRNYSFGCSMAKPEFATRSTTFEGASSIQNVCKLMEQHGLDAEISCAVLRVVNGELPPQELIPTLFAVETAATEDELIAS